MTPKQPVTTLTLFNQTLKIKCDAELVPELHKSFQDLEASLMALRGQDAHHEKLLILAALNSIQALRQENAELKAELDKCYQQLRKDTQSLVVTL